MDDHTSARDIIPWLTGTALLLTFLRWLFKPMIKEVVKDAVGKELTDLKKAINDNNRALIEFNGAVEDIYNLLDSRLGINTSHRRRINVPNLDPELIVVGE